MAVAVVVHVARTFLRRCAGLRSAAQRDRILWKRSARRRRLRLASSRLRCRFSCCSASEASAGLTSVTAACGVYRHTQSIDAHPPQL